MVKQSIRRTIMTFKTKMQLGTAAIQMVNRITMDRVRMAKQVSFSSLSKGGHAACLFLNKRQRFKLNLNNPVQVLTLFRA